MLSVTPTVIVESGTDWAAIIASISTGIAAIAGIGGTIWLASRNWSHDENRVRIAEKRRIYANFITIYNDGMRAAISMNTHMDVQNELATAIVRDYNIALSTCMTAMAELTLIAPDKAIQLVLQPRGVILCAVAA